MTRTRWVRNSGSFCIEVLRRHERQRQRKNSALSGTGALCAQCASHLFGRDRAAVQSEAVAINASGEAVTEYALQVFLGDADAGVDDGDEHRFIRRPDPDRDLFSIALRFVAGVLGVADDVNQDLQDFVPADLYWRPGAVVAAHPHAVATESPFVHPQAVLDEPAYVHRLD